MNQRQRAQQLFDKSGKPLIVGDKRHCPISPGELAQTTSDSHYVVETFDSGLTAEVFHIRIDGKDYTLKKKRPIARVQNLDGEYSFLNEVQRRADFHKLKNDPTTADDFRCIVETVYADYRIGIILSEWIEGTPFEPTPKLLNDLFSTLVSCEQAGLFEWDLCSGNLLLDENNQLKLFDFGYMYPFEPRHEFNSDGINAPLFQFCERFETRFFSGWALDYSGNDQDRISVFRTVKHAAHIALEAKLAWLKKENGSGEVIALTDSLRNRYQQALDDRALLEQLYLVEMFRSHVLDIEDDLHGKSCTPMTMKRVEAVLEMIAQHFTLLADQGALFFDNEGKTQQELIDIYQHKRILVEKYQL